jgi:hypothetical protein
VETSNWRAVCGKTASTVRREGRREPLPYPYRPLRRRSSLIDMAGLVPVIHVAVQLYITRFPVSAGASKRRR